MVGAALKLGALLVLALAAGLAYLQSTLPHSLLFYLPGFIGKLTIPTQAYREVQWSAPPPGLASASASSPRANIVLIIADDLGINDLSGGADVATPRIDSIARRGATFTNAYAGHATCSPSRAALLTGRYGARFGFELTAVPTAMARLISKQPPPPNATADTPRPAFHASALPHVPHYSKMVVPPSERMLSAVLRDTGAYSSAYVGKWHLGEAEGARPQDRGFDETLAFLKGASLYLPLGHPDVVTVPVGDNQDDFLRNNLGAYLAFNNQSRFQTPEYMTDFLAAEAAKAIRAKSTSPYFVTVAFNAPHTPLQAKRSDYDAPELAHIADPKRRAYAAMIRALDRGVGTVLDAVEATGAEKAANTLVIFTSDNGAPYYLGSMGRLHHNAPYRGGKYSFFEGGLRVPLLMQWPRGGVAAGTRCDEPVAHVDIFSTAAAAAGVDLGELATDRVYDGRDVVALLRQRSAEAVEAEEEAEVQPLHESLFWRAGHYHALRRGPLKLQVSERPDAVWLFALDADPTERWNLLSGLPWSELRASVQVAEEGAGVCESLLEGNGLPAAPATAAVPEYVHPPGSRIAHSSPVRPSGAPVAVTRAAVCALTRRLLQVATEQAAPLWPPLLEFPIAIDGRSTAVAVGGGAEYVYWAN